MASRKLAAVNSSHFTDGLDCAWTEQAATRETARKQRAARFIILPPEPPCILALFHVLEPPLFWFNSEAEDDNDLHKEKSDHQTEDAANPIRAEQSDCEKGRENRTTAAKGIADSRSPQADFRGEQFRNVNREERGDQDIDGNSQQESDGDQCGWLMDERINTAEQDSEEGRPDDRWLAPTRVRGECTNRRPERRAERHDERVAERCDDAEPLLNE